MQEAESQGVLSSSDEVHVSSGSSSSSSTKYRRNEGRDAKSQGKRRQANLPQVTGCSLNTALLATDGWLRHVIVLKFSAQLLSGPSL